MFWNGYAFKKMLDHLERIRKPMVLAQNNKLIRRWEKHGDYRQYSLDDRIENLIGEMDELGEALAILGPSDIKDEVLDVRNETEFLWDKLRLDRA